MPTFYFQLICKDNFKYEVSTPDGNSHAMLELDEPRKPSCGENYIKADRFFLVAMPCLFLVFNVVYWLSYGSHLILSLGEGEGMAGK